MIRALWLVVGWSVVLYGTALIVKGDSASGTAFLVVALVWANAVPILYVKTQSVWGWKNDE